MMQMESETESAASKLVTLLNQASEFDHDLVSEAHNLIGNMVVWASRGTGHVTDDWFEEPSETQRIFRDLSEKLGNLIFNKAGLQIRIAPVWKSNREKPVLWHLWTVQESENLGFEVAKWLESTYKALLEWIQSECEPLIYSCHVCGSLFIPKRRDSLYCSVACKQKAYRQREDGTVRTGNI